MVLKPGMIIMAEPNPITADGMFGIFLGHTFIVTGRPRGMRRRLPAGDRGRALPIMGNCPNWAIWKSNTFHCVN